MTKAAKENQQSCIIWKCLYVKNHCFLEMYLLDMMMSDSSNLPYIPETVSWQLAPVCGHLQIKVMKWTHGLQAGHFFIFLYLHYKSQHFKDMCKTVLTCLPLQMFWEIKDRRDSIFAQSFVTAHLLKAVLLKMIRAQDWVSSWPPVLPSHPTEPLSHSQAVS